jgi:hypothetical protein
MTILLLVWVVGAILLMLTPVIFYLLILGPFLFVAWFFKAEKVILKRTNDIMVPVWNQMFSELGGACIIFWPITLLVGLYLLLTWLRDKIYG